MTESIILSKLELLDLPADPDKAHQLLTYLQMLLEWNKSMDLTAVTDKEEVLDRHFLDSLILLKHPEYLKGPVLDLGTGAGFPGLPLAIFRPDLSFTLADAQNKRLKFLEAVIAALELENVTLVHSRAEDMGRSPAFRETFGTCVARAVASLPVLCEYLLPMVSVGGCSVCWKGPSVLDEMTNGRRAAHLLGGHLLEPISYAIPGRDWQHMLLPIEKVSSTPKAYPRKAGTPGKSPLGT